MRDQWTIERLGELRGSPVYDSAGEKIGKVEEIYYDMETRQPEWLGIGTGYSYMQWQKEHAHNQRLKAYRRGYKQGRLARR